MKIQNKSIFLSDICQKKLKVGSELRNKRCENSKVLAHTYKAQSIFGEKKKQKTKDTGINNKL